MTESGVSAATPPGVVKRRRLAGLALDLVPLGLAIVAEAAWISIVGGLLAEYTLQEPQLGIATLALFVAAGVVGARLLGSNVGDRWPSIALLLVALGGMVGWLSSPVARSTLVTSGVIPALGVNVAGWVAGIAVLRGFSHARLPISAGTLATVFAVGVPGIAVAAMAGGMITEPHQSRFLADSLVAAVVFAGGCVLALAIARLTAVGQGSGFDWRRNPTWVALLVVLVVTTLAVAVPASGASPIIALAAGSAIGPLLIVGLVLGFNRGTIRTVFFGVAGIVLVLGILRLLGGGPLTTPGGLGAGATGSSTEPGPGAIGPIGLLVIVLAAMIVVLILARLWSRRTPAEAADVEEVRRIDHGDGTVEAPRRRSARRRSAVDPRGAVEAYQRLLADIDGRPNVRREPAETPGAHAARLRAAGRADLSLELLAADYALARFGGVRLTASEEERAVGRWRRLRRTLGQPGS